MVFRKKLELGAKGMTAAEREALLATLPKDEKPRGNASSARIVKAFLRRKRQRRHFATCAWTRSASLMLPPLEGFVVYAGMQISTSAKSSGRVFFASAIL